MRKIKMLKLANAIKCGPNEEAFLNDERFELSFLNEITIKVKHKQRGDVSHTSIFNTIYWIEDTSEENGKTHPEMKKESLIKVQKPKE